MACYKLRSTGDDDNLLPNFSLVHLMENYADFANEMSQLEFVCKSLGVRAAITTKFHADYACESSKYSWGVLKCLYRGYPLACKRGKDALTSLLINTLQQIS